MNVGDIAVVLTEKDSERLTLRAELNKLKDLQADGNDRLFRVTCTGINKEGVNTSKVVYSYSINHTNFRHNAKAQGEVVDFELLTEDDVIDIIAEVATTNAKGEATTLSFLAQFPTSRVPLTSNIDDTVEVTSTLATEGDEPASPTPAPTTEAPEAPEAAAKDAADVKTETAAPVETSAEETTADATTTAAPAAKPETTTPTSAETAPVKTTLAEDDWVNISLEAVDGDDADSQAELHVTAKRIAIAEAIAEKNAQLEKKVAEIEDLKQQLKTLQANAVKEQQKTSKSSAATSAATKKKTATTTAGKKKITKTTKKTSKQDVEEDDEGDEDDKQKKQSTVAMKSAFGIPSLAELQGYVVGGGVTLFNMALTNRAFVFFGIAACGVYGYGDYASV